jgi:hypothetical protein
LTTQWTVDSCDALRRQTWFRSLTVRSQSSDLPCLAGDAGLSRHADRDLPCAEPKYEPVPVLARFLLAPASKRKLGTSWAGYRSGTISLVSDLASAALRFPS